MSISVILRALAGVALTLIVLDALWLSLAANSLYRSQVGGIMREVPNWGAVVAFYVLYVAGTLVLVVRPALASGGGWTAAAFHGACLGALAYGTFGFTNLAILRPWTLQLALIDFAWGTFLTASAAAAGYLFASTA